MLRVSERDATLSKVESTKRSCIYRQSIIRRKWDLRVGDECGGWRKHRRQLIDRGRVLLHACGLGQSMPGLIMAQELPC